MRHRPLPRHLLPIAALLVALSGCDDGGETPGEPGPDSVVDAAVDASPPDGAPDGPPDAQPDAQPDVLGPDLGLADNFGVTEHLGGPGCENLDPTSCMLPFPSDLFRVGDPLRIDFPPDVLPAHRDGTSMIPDFLTFADGWGVATPVMLHLDGADLSPLPPVFEPAASLAEDAGSILLDTRTGERVAHWVEVDHMTRETPHPVVILRPAGPLDFDTRYVVAFRDLRTPDGEPWDGAVGFSAVRDGTASEALGVHDRRATFEAEVFVPLAEAGVPRESLSIAWSFTTGSEANTRSTLFAVRDAVLADLPPDGPTYRIESTQEGPHPAIARSLAGVLTVPTVLDAPGPDRLRRFTRGPDGHPEVVGTDEIDFTLQWPAGHDPETPLPTLIYGHGLLGSRDEANGGYLRQMARTHGFVILAINMQGMSEADTGVWVFNLVTQAGNFPGFTHAAMQGVVNHVVLAQLARSGVPEAGALDPTRVWYYGNSQGGTMGTLVMAVSDLPYGVLGVPGGSFPFLLQRASGFAQFLGPLQNAFADPSAASLVLGLLGTGFAQLEPLAFASTLGPDRSVLLHVARADAAVHNQISFQLGRAAGAILPTPAVRPVFGLVERPFPVQGTALVEHDFNKPPNPDPKAPKPTEHDTHEDLRRSAPGQTQMMHFLRTGQVINPCDGPCDPD